MMNKDLEKKLGWFFLISLFLLPSFAFAESETPTAVAQFFDIVLNTLKGKGTIIGVALIMIFSAFMAWKNASFTPLIYGAIAAVVMGGAVYIGQSFSGFELNNSGS